MAHDLYAVLAGVAGTCDQDRYRVQSCLGDVKSSGRLVSVPGELGKHLERAGSLQRDERGPIGLIGKLDELGSLRVILKRITMCREPVEVRLAVGRVRYHQVLEVPGVVHDQIVDDPSILVTQQRVLRRTDLGDLSQIVREHLLEEVEGPEAKDAELSHVGDIEDTGRGTNGAVFVDDADVLDRHVKARERYHPGTERNVLIMQRRAFQLSTHRVLLRLDSRALDTADLFRYKIG